MKRIVLILPFILFSLQGRSQTYATPTYHDKIIFSGGAGISLMSYAIDHFYSNDFNSSSESPTTKHDYPAYNLTIDDRIGDKLSLGGGICFEETKDEPFPSGNYPGGSETIWRLNAGMRILHWINKGTYCFYYGPRFGVSFWNDDLVKDSVHRTTYLAKPNQVLPSVQFLLGFEYCFATHFSINLEVAVGSPYCAKAGLCYRILQKD